MPWIESNLRDCALESAGETQLLVDGIFAGLEYLHKYRIVHGDLHWANILIEESPKGPRRAILADFGMTRMLQDGLSSTSGDPRISRAEMFMPPEIRTALTMAKESQTQVTLKPDASTDVFSFGVVLLALGMARPGHAIYEIEEQKLSLSTVVEDLSAARTLARPFMAGYPRGSNEIWARKIWGLIRKLVRMERAPDVTTLRSDLYQLGFMGNLLI
ncbi:hypothetical protein DL93DRAFT_701555 [Clavulina sp. PMI_390]|nr:hypothetical protein DL93DRAFT_701555 [Clavulina sp. PMI_390]